MKKLRLKPQDVVILLYLLYLKKKGPWKYAELAEELKMSSSEVFEAIKRATACDLFDPLTKKPKRKALSEFIESGLRYVFPTKPGEVCQGLPTAHSADPLSKLIISESSDTYVWPSKEGMAEGFKIEPLYKSVPIVAKKSPELYELFALIDALRVGKAREREIAKKEIQERIATA